MDDLHTTIATVRIWLPNPNMCISVWGLHGRFGALFVQRPRETSGNQSQCSPRSRTIWQQSNEGTFSRSLRWEHDRPTSNLQQYLLTCTPTPLHFPKHESNPSSDGRLAESLRLCARRSGFWRRSVYPLCCGAGLRLSNHLHVYALDFWREPDRK